MAKVIWTELSLADLRNIYEFISKDSIFYAARQIEKIVERVEQIENFPDSGRIVPEFNNNSLRELIEGNYRIIYHIVSEEQIGIVRIHHSASSLNK